MNGISKGYNAYQTTVQKEGITTSLKQQHREKQKPIKSKQALKM